MPENIKALMRSDEPFAMPYIKILPSENTFENVLNDVGAMIPTRDVIDERIIHEVRTGEVYYAKKLPKKNPYGDMWGLADESKNDEGTFKHRRLDKESYKLGIITDICQVGGFPNIRR